MLASEQSLSVEGLELVNEARSEGKFEGFRACTLRLPVAELSVAFELRKWKTPPLPGHH